MTGTYANIMKMLCGKKKITLKVRSVISSFMRNDILKYHIEQGEEKRCYRNSLIQNQIFTTLQQQMKKSTLKVVMFVCLFVCFVTRWHALIYAPNNVSWEHTALSVAKEEAYVAHAEKGSRVLWGLSPA